MMVQCFSMDTIRPIHIEIDLQRIVRNVGEIKRRTGVAVLAVVKADAYGLGAERIARAIGPHVDGFCVFSLDEAIEADLWQTTGKPIIALGPPTTLNPEPYLQQHVRPAVTTVEQATALAPARPVLALDTGMQRFAAPIDRADAIVRAGQIDEVFTHATKLEHAKALKAALGNRGLRLHAAASALLDEPEAWLDAVRPGLAMYDGAARVTGTLVEVHDTRGAAGYGGFLARRHGVILGGYAHGIRAGACLMNGQRRRIIEVGMQSSYIEIDDDDHVGDEVVLLGESLTAQDAAREWGSSPQEVLVRLTSRAHRSYTN